MSTRPPDLSREAAAARDLLAALRDAGHGDDEMLLADAVEGETDFGGAVSAAVSRIADAEAMEAACKARAADVLARAARFGESASRARGTLASALEYAGVPMPVRTVDATVSLTRRAPRPIVTDPDALPSDCCREKVTRSPDMAEITRRVQAGQVIPGVGLDNGSVALNIRRK